jgi:hypothetical protein
MIALLGFGCLAWAAISIITGKGWYKGCPPGGFDRATQPWSFWVPTVCIICLGLFAILLGRGGVINTPVGGG